MSDILKELEEWIAKSFEVQRKAGWGNQFNSGVNHVLVSLDQKISDMKFRAENVDSIRLSVRGSCGNLHPSLEHWQKCTMCAFIDGKNANYVRRKND